MTTLQDAQVALVKAQQALDLRDYATAFAHAQHAAFCCLDLRGTADPIRLSGESIEGAVQAAAEKGEGK